MTIPEKIRIGSVDYTVEKTDEYLKLDQDQCAGIIDFEKQSIKIANNVQHEQRQEQTFLHELIHGIVHEYHVDFEDDEEKIVDTIALGLHQVIRDNFQEPVSIRVGDIEIKRNYEKVCYNSISKIGTCIDKINRIRYMYKIIAGEPGVVRLNEITEQIKTNIVTISEFNNNFEVEMQNEYCR